MKLSRSKVELFVDCPRCFYTDQVKKIPRPPGFPFSLNNAVDQLLKKEFDTFRATNQMHPLQASSGLSFKPAQDDRLDQWRDAFAGGISYDHPEHGCKYYGAIDDLWVNEEGEYAVVDYKATAALRPVSELPAWADGYRRQLSFYSWLLKKNGTPMLNTGYLVYATASTAREAFNNRLEFDLNLVPVDLDDSWVDPTLDQLQALLKSETAPQGNENCKFCRYRGE